MFLESTIFRSTGMKWRVIWLCDRVSPRTLKHIRSQEIGVVQRSGAHVTDRWSHQLNGGPFFQNGIVFFLVSCHIHERKTHKKTRKKKKYATEYKKYIIWVCFQRRNSNMKLFANWKIQPHLSIYVIYILSKYV